VRSLELNSNDFSRLARSTLLSKIRSISALGGRFRLLTAHNLAVLAVVLETFQTYYAFSRAVNPSTSSVTGSTGRSLP
jgi:hypothetical protein